MSCYLEWHFASAQRFSSWRSLAAYVLWLRAACHQHLQSRCCSLLFSHNRIVRLTENILKKKKVCLGCFGEVRVLKKIERHFSVADAAVRRREHSAAAAHVSQQSSGKYQRCTAGATFKPHNWRQKCRDARRARLLEACVARYVQFWRQKEE